jgi:hypothetical protein
VTCSIKTIGEALQKLPKAEGCLHQNVGKDNSFRDEKMPYLIIGVLYKNPAGTRS